MNKCIKTTLSLVSALVFAFGAIGCGDDGGKNKPVKAEIGIAAAEDKILQSYAGDTDAMKAFRERFMGGLTDTFAITSFRNEYESKQIIISPDKDVKAYDVTVSDFKNGSETLPASCFDLRHQYYHEIETIFDKESTMLAGMYPDALVPMSAAKKNGLNTIKKGENQGVYVTVKVPKDQAVGVYTGEFTVTLDGTTKKVPASVTVLDYTLPDTVSLKSCIPLQPAYMMQGELDDTQAMYTKYVEALNEYRLSVQYLESYYAGSAGNFEHIDFVATTAAELAVEAAKDPSVSCYAIKVHETPTPNAKGGFVAELNENTFRLFLEKYVDVGLENDVNLFEKAYVFMGNIIDEPDVHAGGGGGDGAYEWVDYVCKQYENVLAGVADYAREKNAPAEVVEDILNMPNVITGGFTEKAKMLTEACPTIDILQKSTTREDYAAKRAEGGDYWWYTCTVPKIPYPGYHIDDNGVSSRVMSWMAKEYDVTGYLTWECICWNNWEGEKLKGMRAYEDTQIIGDCWGDGVLFYPGAPLGVDGPVPSIRLHNMRDGMEDFEAINDLENIYATLGETYASTLSADGVMNELYASLYGDVRVFCDSGDVAKAKELLGELTVLAADGVAISDFKVDSTGKVNAKIYAPADLALKLNGTAAQGGVPVGTGVCYTVEAALDKFSVEANGTKFELTTKATVSASPTTAANIRLFDKGQNVIESVNANTVDYEGVSTLEVAMDTTVARLDISLADKEITSSTNSVTLCFYSQATEMVEVNFSIYGASSVYALDTVYVKPGYNEITFERIGDLAWSRLRKATALIMTFGLEEAWTINFVGAVIR